MRDIDALSDFNTRGHHSSLTDQFNQILDAFFRAGEDVEPVTAVLHARFQKLQMEFQILIQSTQNTIEKLIFEMGMLTVKA
jgi:hypothetical protein